MDTHRAAAATAAIAFALAPYPAAAACLASPVQDDNPTNGTRTGIAEPIANELWVSGTLRPYGAETLPYVERFDPVVGWSTLVLGALQQSAFNSIAAFSARQAIAVGFTDGGATAMAVAFDGGHWFETLGSHGTRYRGSLQKVAVVPRTQTAYAVLAYGSANLLYWSGSAWSAVADELPTGAVLSVSASSRHDVWAVGGKTNSLGQVRGLVERFDGRQWIEMHAPAPLTLLTGIDARRPDDAWVIGLTQQGSRFTPFAAQWNGAHWQQVFLPRRLGVNSAFGDVYAESANSVWLSVLDVRSGGTETSLWHWNGNEWRYVLGSKGWSDAPIFAGFPDRIYFAAGAYRRAHRGNQWLGTAGCGVAWGDSIDNT